MFQTLVLFKKESAGCAKSLSSSASVALQEKVQPDPPGVSQAAGVALVPWDAPVLHSGINSCWWWEEDFNFQSYNLGPSREAPHNSTGALSSLGEAKIEIFCSFWNDTVPVRILCVIFPCNQNLCARVCEDRIFGVLGFWCKLLARDILELLIVCLPTVVPLGELHCLPVHRWVKIICFQPLQNFNAK